MRLIDADEFKRQIVGMAIINNYPADEANKLCELIDTQPTAYDVDKVKEQLNTEAMYEDVPVYEGDKEADCYIRVSKAIEIVEGGGTSREKVHRVP